jgi:hypothetical protein
LPQLLENNLGPSVIFFYRTMNLNHLILQLTHIPNALEVMGKNHDGEWTDHRILAEIEKRYAPSRVLHAKDSASNALILADVLACLSNRNAIGGSGQSGKKQSDRESAEKQRTKSAANLEQRNEQCESVAYLNDCRALT